MLLSQHSLDFGHSLLRGVSSTLPLTGSRHNCMLLAQHSLDFGHSLLRRVSSTLPLTGSRYNCIYIYNPYLVDANLELVELDSKVKELDP
jgi:hypothetical protein